MLLDVLSGGARAPRGCAGGRPRPTDPAHRLRAAAAREKAREKEEEEEDLIKSKRGQRRLA